MVDPESQKNLTNIVHEVDVKQIIKCILCDNILELNLNESVPFPYVCKDCKDAIAYAKYLQTHLEFK